LLPASHVEHRIVAHVNGGLGLAAHRAQRQRKDRRVGIRKPDPSENVVWAKQSSSPNCWRSLRSVTPGVRIVFEISARVWPRARRASSAARAPTSTEGGTIRIGREYASTRSRTSEGVSRSFRAGLAAVT